MYDRESSTRESRKAPRLNVAYPVWLQYGDDVVLIPCKMKDISPTGARLALPNNEDIPDEFVLKLSESGPAHRKCRVAWRSKSYMGVYFIT
jgi:hypothetical protein